MYFDLEQLHKQVADVFDEVAAFRRDIHMHPELSEHEARTETKICDWLNALDIPYEKGIAGHGICATIYGQRTDKTAAIRADIDALPVTEQTGLPYASQNAGVMHACGHDMHTSILLGVAKILKANQASLPGTVRLLFQPSEETIGGARQMIEVGCLQDPDIKNIIALHVEPNVDCGKLEFVKGYMNAATCEFRLTVKGRSCHGAHPDGGIDVLPPACAIVSGLQTIVTRNIPPTTPVIISIGTFHSGTASRNGSAKWQKIQLLLMVPLAMWLLRMAIHRSKTAMLFLTCLPRLWRISSARITLSMLTFRAWVLMTLLTSRRVIRVSTSI